MRVDRPHPGEELNEGEVTEPRQAASIIVLRDSPDGPEVLLVERNPKQRFMGGAWVFPGGAVHAGDADHAAHFGFPKEVGARLREEGRVGPHPVAPDKPAWAARRIETDEDVLDVIELLRLNYDRVVARHGLPEEVEA